MNRQIVDESDFGIALFWARLGTPTGTHAAGSLEEIEQLQRRGARVLIYFKNAPVPQALLKDDQYGRVSEFKTKMEKEGLLGTFSGTHDLAQQVLLHITGVVADLLKRDRAQPQPDENKQAILTAAKPDVRVVVFPMETIPPTPGINHLLGIRVQNHSPVVVFVSGISILLKSNKGLLLYRDAVTGTEQRRRMLHPGESFQWSANGDTLLAEYAVENVDDVVVYDDIGRDYRPPKGILQQTIQQWKAGEPKK